MKSMKKHKTLGNALSMLTASALLLSLCVIPSAAADSAAAPAAVFENTSGDGGSNGISLSAERTFQASIPVDMTEAEAKEAIWKRRWDIHSSVVMRYLIHVQDRLQSIPDMQKK